MKIFVTGTRGIPNVPGGVEKHCEQLYPLIVSYGHKVLLASRKGYVKNIMKEWKGVDLLHLYTIKSKNLEALAHTFLAIFIARLNRCDIVHIHAIGPAIATPFARLLGMKVVITHHGPDYNRQKWGLVAKFALKSGEWIGGKFAHEIIGISNTIKANVFQRCKRILTTIYNGVSLPQNPSGQTFLERNKIVPKRYILVVSRIEPEKGIHLLINAFEEIKINFKLVIVGYSNYETKYNRYINRKITKNNNIIATGFLTGDSLNQLYHHAGLFVLPSYHEGLPIALLEAMSYGLSVLVSDIPANLEVNLDQQRYFQCGNVDDLKTKMEKWLASGISENEKARFRQLIEEKYNWKTIALQTIQVYERTLKQ